MSTLYCVHTYPRPQLWVEMGWIICPSSFICHIHLSHFPSQAAGAGDMELQRRLMGMPEGTRREMARLAARAAEASAHTSAHTSSMGPAAEGEGVEEGGEDGGHSRAVAEAVSAARATAAWWGAEDDGSVNISVDDMGSVDEDQLARDLALMMEAPVRCGQGEVRTA